MSRTRIAVFEGVRRYGFTPREMPRGMGRYGFTPREMPRGMGAPLFNNPRPPGGLGRRAYTVEPLYGRSSYGPPTSSGRKARRLKRRGYKVKKGRNSPAQVRFKKAAKSCARTVRGSGKSRLRKFNACMRRKLKKSRR